MRSGEGLRPLAPLAILPVGGPAGLPAMLPECGQGRQMTTFSSCSASSGTVRGLDPFTLLNPYSHGIFRGLRGNRTAPCGPPGLPPARTKLGVRQQVGGGRWRPRERRGQGDGTKVGAGSSGPGSYRSGGLLQRGGTRIGYTAGAQQAGGRGAGVIAGGTEGSAGAR